MELEHSHVHGFNPDTSDNIQILSSGPEPGAQG